MHEGAILKSTLKYQGRAMGDVAVALGMSRQNLNYHLRKETLDDNFRRLVQEVLNIDLKKLVDINSRLWANLNATKQIIANSRQKSSLTQENQQIPFFNIDFHSSEFLKIIELPSQSPPLMLPEFQNCIAFKSYSDTVQPLINPTTIVIAKEVSDWNNFIELGKLYAIVDTEQRPFIKYLRKSNNADNFVLKSINNKYDEVSIAKNSIACIWQIQGLVNKLV